MDNYKKTRRRCISDRLKERVGGRDGETRLTSHVFLRQERAVDALGRGVFVKVRKAVGNYDRNLVNCDVLVNP